MYLTILISRVAQGHYQVLVHDAFEVMVEFEASSIGAALRKASQLDAPGLDGFHVWYAGVYSGSAGLSLVASDPEGFGALIVYYPRQGGS